jgi:esterase
VTSPPLAFDIDNTTATTTVVFLHGILGSRGNWRSFAKRLVQARPDVCTVLLDLRRHGESHAPTDSDTVEHCAADVHALMQHLGRSCDVWVGHSFGGKVATIAALAGSPSRPAQALWSLDSPPGTRTFLSGASVVEEVEGVLRAVAATPMPCDDRRDVVAFLQGRGLSVALCQWMTTNLVRGPDNLLRWKMDLAAMPALLQSFGAYDAWPLIHERSSSSPSVWMVRGGRSDRWRSDELSSLERAVALGQVRDHVLVDAGHWLHTDDADGLLGHMLENNLGCP